MINWRGPIISLLSALQGSKRMKYYRKVIGFSRMPEGKLKKLQKDKLEALLIHAHKHVPYYKEVLEQAGVVRNGQVNLRNFENIPILTKDILKERFSDLLSDDHEQRKSFENHSGGSTGEPTKFIQDKEYDDWNIANKMYYQYIGGKVPGEREVRIWGSERDFMGDKEKPILRIRNFFFNRVDLNAFTMTEEKMRQYVDFINRYRPSWIEGYVSPIYEMAVFIEKNDLKIVPPKGCLTSAGTLYPQMRKKIEKVFNCPVWNRYGGREVGDAAIGRDDLRMSVWNQYLEVVKDGKALGPNKMGKVLMTTLNNYSMPLIRYDIGDIAQKSTKWGWLRRIEGRESEVFRTRDGKVVPPQLFIHFLGVVMNDGSIKKFQVIQKSFDEIEVKIVISDKEGFEKSRNEIEELINKAMGYRCKIVWSEVEDIPKLASGKYVYIMSLLKG
jgi:phenylacetate-CoA ligase